MSSSMAGVVNSPGTFCHASRAVEHVEVSRMNSGNNETRRRRTVPKKHAAAPASAAKTGKSKPKVHRDKPASMDVRGAAAKQPSKARQGITNKSSLSAAKPAKPRAAKRPPVRLSRKHGTSRRTVDSRERDSMATPLLAAIVQSSEAAIIGTTLDGIVTSWNQSAERIFGLTTSEMVGRPIHIIAAPSNPKEMGQILDRIRRGECVEHYETDRLRKDGRIVQISLTVSPIHDEKGRIVGASQIAQDITGRRNTEAQFQAKRDQFEILAHALDQVPAMVRKLDGEIMLWGHGLQALYGWPAEKAVGSISHELLATEFPVPLPAIEAELLDTGLWQGELVRTHLDGRLVIVASRWALYRRDGGDPVSVLEFDSDVTETKRVQSMLKEREARLRSILETAPDAIIAIDERGIIQSFSKSAEKLFGYAPGEVIGRNVQMLMPAPHRENHDGYLARYLRTGEKRIIGIGRQVEAQRKDGTIFPIELAIGEVKLAGSHVFKGFIRDMTARIKMEQDLRQAQKMEAIGQLTGGGAHDFNNLLTVISGNLEMLDRRLNDPEHREILNEAREASKLGAELTKRLLAFGRRQPLNPKPTELNTLADGMVELLRRSLGEAVEIETRLAEALPMIIADPGQVENALLNLAINARDAMPNGGRLVIETARAEIDEDYAAAGADVVPGRYITLAVTDTGTGMSPEVRQRASSPSIRRRDLA
jgi:PAS domain S-box-containing protein